MKDYEAAARTLGLQSLVLTANSELEIDAAFATVAQQPASALVVGGGPIFGNMTDKIIAQAALHRVPAIYPTREFTDAGGLMSYGASFSDGIAYVAPMSAGF